MSEHEDRQPKGLKSRNGVSRRVRPSKSMPRKST
jgi:hypothetical protein